MNEGGILKRIKNSWQERQSVAEWEEIRNDKQGLIKWDLCPVLQRKEFYWGCQMLNKLCNYG